MPHRKRVTATAPTAAIVCLASAIGIHLSCQNGRADEEPRVAYSLDQESGAAMFDSGRFSTADFLRSLKTADLGVRRLVISARVVTEELKRIEADPSRTDPAAKEKARREHVKKIVDAANEANILLTRLAIVPVAGEPSLASVDAAKQQEAAERLAGQAQLAADLGCQRMNVVLAASGPYAEQKVMAVEGLGKLRDVLMARRLGHMFVLLGTGPGLCSNGVWLRQVLDDAMKQKKVQNVGLLLDVAELDYSPRTAFNELTGRDPVTRLEPPAGTGGAGSANPSQPTTTVPPTTPSRVTGPHDRARDVKAIVLDAFDRTGGVDIPGLGNHLSRKLLTGFEGEISVRYRGRSQFGLKASLKAVSDHFGPEAATQATTPSQLGAANGTPGSTTQPGTAGVPGAHSPALAARLGPPNPGATARRLGLP